MPELSRRDAALASIAALCAAGSHPAAAQQRPADAETPAAHDMSAMPRHWMGSEKIAFLIYPGMTALDMVGPHYMLTNLVGAKTQIVAKSREPVKSDTGLVFLPMRISKAANGTSISCACPAAPRAPSRR